MAVSNSENSDSTDEDDGDNDDVKDQGLKDFQGYFNDDGLQGFLELTPVSVLVVEPDFDDLL